MTAPLITAAQARAQIPALRGTDQDARLDALVGAADAIFARHCGWPAADDGTYTLGSVARTDYPARWCDDPTEMQLSVFPVASVTSIAEDTTSDRTYATTVSTADYSLFDAANGLIFRADGWTIGRKYTRIRYVGGVDPTALPGDLQFCFERMVRHLWDAPAAATDILPEGATYRSGFRDYIPELIRPYLAPYRRAAAILGG